MVAISFKKMRQAGKTELRGNSKQISLLDSMKVDPITEVKHLKSIKRLLSDSPRDKLLFVAGINSGLRVQDLLSLKVKDLMERKEGDRVVIKEKISDTGLWCSGFGASHLPNRTICACIARSMVTNRLLVRFRNIYSDSNGLVFNQSDVSAHRV